MKCRLFENKLENNNDIIQEAVHALNQLTNYYQQYDCNNHDTKVTIELESPWKKEKLFGGDTFGIIGIVVLKTQSSKLFEHPFGIKLEEMGFRTGTHQYHSEKDNFEFRGIFTLVNSEQIAQIPEKCQKIINENRRNLTI